MKNIFEELNYVDYLFPNSIDEIDEMSGNDFENFIYYFYLVTNPDIKIIPNGKINDCGIDLILEIKNSDQKLIRIGIQAKRWNSKIGKQELTKMLEGKITYNLNYLWIITNNTLTNEASQFAKAEHILVKDRLKIQEMLNELKEYPTIKYRKSKIFLKKEKTIKTYIFNELENNLLKDLKTYRFNKSKELKIPAYIVFTNQTLFELVKKKPNTINELYKITGLGEERINNFSNDLLAIIKNKKN